MHCYAEDSGWYLLPRTGVVVVLQRRQLLVRRNEVAREAMSLRLPLRASKTTSVVKTNANGKKVCDMFGKLNSVANTHKRWQIFEKVTPGREHYRKFQKKCVFLSAQSRTRSLSSQDKSP